MKRIYIVILCVVIVGHVDAFGQKTSSTDMPIQTLLQRVADMFSASDTKASQAFADTLSRRLLRDFDTRLECPECFRDTVINECDVFPEGTIYSFAVPAFAYANIAVSDPSIRHHAQQQIATLIDVALPIVIQEVEPPNQDVLQLSTYQHEATYLGTLYLMLAHYALIGGDSRYEALHTHLADLFIQALRNSQGESLHSYPEYTWHFDTLFVLTALYLDDLRAGTQDAQPFIEQHLRWKAEHATHPDTGLPVAHEGSLPRGCDLSMQIGLLSQIAPDTAATLYPKYVAAHWVDHGFLAGFAEWPHNTRETGLLGGDFDSGPILMNIGLTATGISLVTTQAMQDRERFQRLRAELQMVAPMIQMLANMDAESELTHWFTMYAPLNAAYSTGFLYGDAMMLYALTWIPYSAYQP